MQYSTINLTFFFSNETLIKPTKALVLGLII